MIRHLVCVGERRGIVIRLEQREMVRNMIEVEFHVDIILDLC